jgi:hypothetical protein
MSRRIGRRLDDISADHSPGRGLAESYAWDMVRYALREMSDDEWARFRARLTGLFTNPRKAQDLEVLELFFRKGETQARMLSSHRHASVMVYDTVARIARNPELMMDVSRMHDELKSVPTVTREEMGWALQRMPAELAEGVIRLIQMNTLLESDRERDRNLARDLYIEEASDEELMERYGLTKNGLKATVGSILTGLTQRPLARMPVREYVDRASAIPGMTLEEAKDWMPLLGDESVEHVVSSIPKRAWRRRDLIERHSDIFTEYIRRKWTFREFAGHYVDTHPGAELTIRGAEQTVNSMLRKIVSEPGLRERLRGGRRAVQASKARSGSALRECETAGGSSAKVGSSIRMQGC